MKMRKKLLSLLILALLTMGMLSALNLGPVVVSAYDSPAVYVDPIFNDAGPKPPATYTITIETDYGGDDITAYQFSLTYNPNVLAGVSVVNDGILSDATFKPGTFDNVAGKLSTTAAYFFGAGVVRSGPGKLATITFDVVGLGDSELILGSNTLLKGWDAILGKTYDIVDGVSMPFHIGHGYFENLKATHDVAVTGVTPSATSVVKGELVTIDVDVENQGDVVETFDVTVWTGLLSLGTQTVTNLLNGTGDTLTFNWDTTGYAVASYTLVAVASTVSGETDTADNTFEDGIVTVKPVITAAFTVSPSPAITMETVTFDASGSETHGADIVLYEWDFGREVVETTLWQNVSATGEVVGVGDGANTVFNFEYGNVVPGTETVYLDGTITTDYTIMYLDGRLNFNTAPDVGVVVTADYFSAYSFEEMVPRIYNSTVPIFEYKYNHEAVYGIWLWVTDSLRRKSTPAYGTLAVYYPKVVGADLVHWKAKSEKATWFESLDGDGYVNITALAVNQGVGQGAVPINVEIIFQILLGRGGAPMYTITVPYTLAEPGVNEEILWLFEPRDYGWDGLSAKYFHMRATIKYDSDLNGTPDAYGSSKDFKFQVKP
jgi:hypothetical protein